MKLLQHPSVRLLGVTVAVGVAVRALFFQVAPWLWSFALPVPASDLLPWALPAMVDRDGAEPYGLLAAVMVQLLLTGLAFTWLTHVAPRWRALILAALLVVVGVFAYRLPPRPPLHAVATDLSRAWKVVAGSLVAAWLLARAVRRGTRASTLVAAVLVPLCFIPTNYPSLVDLSCVLAPALRLAHGASPREIYMQYDLFPSLLAIGWTKLGASAFSFWVVCSAAYYAMLIGIFVIARRLFLRPQLAGPMLLALVILRLFAPINDPASVPQVTPLRLDLWPLLVAAALVAGLRRWPVGLVTGLMYFFARGVGELYIGAYALALAADFFARRHATPAAERAPFASELRSALRETAVSLALVVLSLAAGRAVFGRFGSEGIEIYRRLGIGMLRVDRTSFYWWLLPLTGAAGWLVFSRRGSLPPKRAEAATLSVALLVANSIYFFGRSHEHNLINTSVSFIFCLFLALDLAWPSADSDPAILRWGFRLAPYLVLAVCAYNYSARVVKRLDQQQSLVLEQHPLAGELPPSINCDEIRRAAGDDRIFFLSRNDYWFYEACKLTPPSTYLQPITLTALRQPLVDELRRLLDSGVKVFVPRDQRDWCARSWPDLSATLPRPQASGTSAFMVYRPSAQAQN